MRAIASTSRFRSVLSLVLLFLALGLGVGCGQSVRFLSIHDARLPLEARRWLADAEDAVTVTMAWRDEAREEVEETRAWQKRSVVPLPWPSTPEAVAAQSALADLSRERLRLARLRLAVAEAEVELSEIRRAQVNAETAVRYDLRNYDIDRLLEATREARSRVEQAASEVATQRRIVEDATSTWWRTYQSYVSAGGDPRVLWAEAR